MLDETILKELYAIDREVEQMALDVAQNPELRSRLGPRANELENRYVSLIKGAASEEIPDNASETIFDARFVQADEQVYSLRLGRYTLKK